MLCSRAANLGMLIGLDCNQYLLKPLDKLNGAHISVPHEAANLTLNASKLSSLLSVVGTIGPNQSGLNLGDARTFRMNVKPEKGLFSFFTEPSDQDIESIKNQFENHLVETFPRFDVPALPPPATTTTTTSDTVHNQLFSRSDFPALPPPSKQSHTEEIRTQIFTNSAFSSSSHSPKKKLFHQSRFYSILSLFFLLGLARGKTSFPRYGDGVHKEDYLPNPLLSLLAKKNHKNKLAVSNLMDVGFSLQDNPFDLKQDDPTSEDLDILTLCPECKNRSKVCPDCKLRNSPLSLIESKEDQIIFECISIKKGKIVIF